MKRTLIILLILIISMLNIPVCANSVLPAPLAGETVYTATITLTAKAVGDSYGGGIVAYILKEGDPGYDAGEQHGLIAATEDQSTGMAWSNITSTLVGGTDAAYGTGAANTTKIIAQVGHSSSAAKVCADYTVTVNSVTYDDWYLPSKDELNKLYLKKDAVGGFTDNYYWSSSGYSANFAWFQAFNVGSQDSEVNECDTYRVRAVRAF